MTKRQTIASLVGVGLGAIQALTSMPSAAEVAGRAVSVARGIAGFVPPLVHRVDRSRAVKLDAPLRLRPHSFRYRSGRANQFVEHGPLQDFNCGRRTRHRHFGSDYLLRVHPWSTMDAEEVEIIAAAAGTIIEKEDTLFDRNCDIAMRPNNRIILQQDDGLFAFYLHLKTSSATTKPMDSRVSKGEYLGLVGSAGQSAEPHLHFELREVRDDPGTVIDPYAGPCGDAASGGDTISLWKHQPEYVDTEILRLATHSADPSADPSSERCTSGDPPTGPAAPDPQFSNVFLRGATVYVAAYLKDRTSTTALQLEVFDPDGSRVYRETIPGVAQPFSSIVKPVPVERAGFWTLRATLEGRAAEHTFQVGGTPPPTTRVRLRLDPLARSPRTGEVTTVTAFVENLGASDAYGCWIAPDYFLAATVDFQRLGRVGWALKPIGRVNENLSIPAGGNRRVKISIMGKSGYAAQGAEVPFRIKCMNADGERVASGYNTMWLSFEDKATPNVDVVVESVRGPSGPMRFRTATVLAKNIGAAGMLGVRPYSNRAETAPSICELAGDSCVMPHALSVSRRFGEGEEVRFEVRATFSLAHPDRVIIELTDEQRTIRGANGFDTW